MADIRRAAQVLSAFYGAPQPRSPLSALDANRLVVGGPRARRTPGAVLTTLPHPRSSAAVQAGSAGVRVHAATSPMDWVARGAGAMQEPAGGSAGACGAGSWADAAGVAAACEAHKAAAAAAPGSLPLQQQGDDAAQSAGSAAAQAADGEAPRSQQPLPWPAGACSSRTGAAGARQSQGDDAPSAAAREPDLAFGAHGAGAEAAADAGSLPESVAQGAAQTGARAWQQAGLLTAQLTAIAAAAAAAATAAVHGWQRAEQGLGKPDLASRAASPAAAVGAQPPAQSATGDDGKEAGTTGGAAGARRAGYDPAAYSSRDAADGAGPGSAAAAGVAQATASMPVGAAAGSAAPGADPNPQAEPSSVVPRGWFPAVFLPPPPGLWGYRAPVPGVETAAPASAGGAAGLAEAPHGPLQAVPGPPGLQALAGAAEGAGTARGRGAGSSGHAAPAAPSASSARGGQVSMPGLHNTLITGAGMKCRRSVSPLFALASMCCPRCFAHNCAHAAHLSTFPRRQSLRGFVNKCDAWCAEWRGGAPRR